MRILDLIIIIWCLILICIWCSIPLERHQAEIRRAVADEGLNTIADSIMGEESRTEWLAEGRRLIPLIPRSIPQTKACQVATSVSTAFLHKQLKESHESDTSCTQSDTQERSEPRDKRANDLTNKSDTTKYSSSNISCRNSAHKKARLTETGDALVLPEIIKESTPTQSDMALTAGFVHASSLTKGPTHALTLINKSSVNSSSASLVTSVSCNSMPNHHNAETSYIPATPTIRIATPISSNASEISNFIASNAISESKSNVIQLPSNTVKFTPAQIAVPCNSSGARILSTGKPGTIASQVVVISSNSQPKTITIPISQSVKTLQLPVGSVSSSGTPTIFYQTAATNNTSGLGSNIAASGTVKSIPTGFTIKAFKPGQSNLSGNFIIMPKNATMVRPANIRTITLSKETANLVSSVASTTATTSESKDSLEHSESVTKQWSYINKDTSQSFFPVYTVHTSL